MTYEQMKSWEQGLNSFYVAIKGSLQECLSHTYCCEPVKEQEETIS